MATRLAEPNSCDRAIDRRAFLRAGGTAVVAGATAAAGRRLYAAERAEKPRVAAIVTEFRSRSHADVIVGRFLEGYTLSTEETFEPRTQVVSMYVDQFPRGDLSRGMAARHGVQMKPTIRQALTLDTGKLAVDGVLIIGEHGEYPFNEKGQHMYPRRRFFEETVETFHETGMVAPVFSDKHLGFAWEDAKWMFGRSRAKGFPLMAGSSLPTTWRKPDVELPLGVELEEGLAIGYGGTEAYGFHALETLQCMVERRRGGEAGVRAVTYVEGDDVWRAAANGQWSRELLDAALACVEDRPRETPEAGCRKPAAFLIEHADGLRSSVIMLGGYTSAFGFAGKLQGRPQPAATHFWLEEPNYGHFSYLTHNIETMFLTGEEPYPPERTLLTTGILDAVMTSRAEGHRRVETPWLADLTYEIKNDNARRGMFA